MPNDTNTLNGALMELGETMAQNLVAQGVTGASASDGLTTLANKILDIQTGGGGSCYHIEFSEDSYIAVGGSVTLECTLQQNYAPLSGATVTLSDGTSVYSSITNSSGVATFSLTGLTTSATYTCSYNNVSDTCTVTSVTYYFIDDCSVDNTSNYTNQQLRNGSGTATLVYNSSERAYACNKTTSGYALLQFGDCILHNNMKISADIKISSSWANNGMLGFADATNPKTAYSFGGFAQGQRYYRIMEHNGNSELQTTSNTTWSNLSITDYNHHELIYQDGVVTYTITNPSNVSKTLTLTLRGTNYIGGKVGLYVECNTSPNCYIKNIIAEPI